jgi:transcriptional regulator with XRE-family HTH domain
MTPNEFRAWRVAMGWSQEAAAAQLGVSRRTVQHYELGRPFKGKTISIPRTVALAC